MSKQFPPRTGDIALDPANLLFWLDKIAQYFNQEPQAWTPTLSFATPGDFAAAYGTQVGYWWRMGNVVRAVGSIITSSFTYTTASGNNRINGLPVASKTAAGLVQVGECWSSGWTTANYTKSLVRLASASTSLNLVLEGSGQAIYIPTTTDMATTVQQVRHFNIEYFTD